MDKPTGPGSIHCHIWKGDELVSDGPDAEWSGTYPDHIQYALVLPDGSHLELRVFFKDLPEMMRVAILQNPEVEEE